VIFLGANFDNAEQARAYGNAPRATAQVAAACLDSATTALAGLRAAYAVSDSAMGFTEEEKKRLSNPNPPEDHGSVIRKNL